MRDRATSRQVARFLNTGEADPILFDWPGQNVLEKCRNGSDAMLSALLAEVMSRAGPHVQAVAERASVPADLTTFTRRLVEPMVRGLFPGSEVDPVLAVLERSVVFLTPEGIEQALRQAGFLHTAWTLANIYLGSLGAPTLGKKPWRVVGLSDGTRCYVSLEYFTLDDPFADFIVHEAAHVFHNTKRRALGLPHTRRREWLLSIAFEKRETFAYACEAYSRVLQLARTPAGRRARLAELRERRPPSDERVDAAEYLSILEEAVGRRNGWKTILTRCG